MAGRTNDFVMSSVQAPSDTPVLFVKLDDGNLSLARLDDVKRLVAAAREAVYDEIQEFVVGTAFDTTVGRRIDEFIMNRLIDLHEDEDDGATE
jgi:hypothetical protein